MTGLDDIARSFEGERGRLTRLAYRITGSVFDAEDAVQEAWVRLQRADAESIDDLPAWLTTTVGRLCLDRLKAAAVRREAYVGTWLPEPVVMPVDASVHDPLNVVVRDEEARYAAMVVLEVLAPQQRVALVLHDAFAVPFAQIADVLGVSAANARQLASRARSRVSEVPAAIDPREHAEAVERLVSAVLAGDLEAVVAALHPDVRVVGDADGRTPTARRMLQGPAEVARFMLGLVRVNGPEEIAALRPAAVNGYAGLATAGTDARHPARITAFAVHEGLVWGVWDIAQPDKLGGVRLPDWSPSVPPLGR